MSGYPKQLEKKLYSLNVSSHIFKFQQPSRERNYRIGKRCYPEETYGISKQSPTYFKLNHTLISPRGYQFIQNNVQYLSSKDYIHLQQNLQNIQNVNIRKKPPNSQFKKTFDMYMTKNKPFNRRKGLFSQFIEKNKHMAKVMPIFGMKRNVRKSNNKSSLHSYLKRNNQYKNNIRRNIFNQSKQSNEQKFLSISRFRETKDIEGFGKLKESLNKKTKSINRVQRRKKETSRLSEYIENESTNSEKNLNNYIWAGK